MPIEKNRKIDLVHPAISVDIPFLIALGIQIAPPIGFIIILLFFVFFLHFKKNFRAVFAYRIAGNRVPGVKYPFS